jgi:hypothetical protein
MATTLPYLSTPGSLKTCLEKIKVAATPDRVTQDFITTKLQIKGGTGGALIPYLKKIGLVASDGSPTELYKQFRNKSSAGGAIAKAVKGGYKDLLDVNEYFYDLDDAELFSLIVQVTGAEESSQVAKLTLSTLKSLKAFADFDAKEPATAETKTKHRPSSSPSTAPDTSSPPSQRSLGLNLSYTINLNLPVTSDQAVFNAIFRSLKEHLLNDHE